MLRIQVLPEMYKQLKGKSYTDTDELDSGWMSKLPSLPDLDMGSLDDAKNKAKDKLKGKTPDKKQMKDDVKNKAKDKLKNLW